MIQINSVFKEYNVGKSNIRVLDNFSLTIKSNSYLSIVGPSGSGKSTLLNIIGGLETINGGEVWVNDNPVHKMKEKELANLRFEHIGYIFQQFQLIPSATALENVMLPLLKFFSKSDIRKRAEETLIRVGLKNRIDHLPSRLSGGEQQRVAIARALVTEPKIILADEPTGNLDSENSTKIIELLESIYNFDGTTLVIVTHDNDIAKRAKDIIHLKDGKIK